MMGSVWGGVKTALLMMMADPAAGSDEMTDENIMTRDDTVITGNCCWKQDTIRYFSKRTVEHQEHRYRVALKCTR
jgi:hypothetical protein